MHNLMSSTRPVVGRCRLLLVLAGFFVMTVSSVDESTPASPSPSSSPFSSSSTPPKNGDGEPRSRTKVISLAESIIRSQKYYQDPQRAKASKEQWERALVEIKNLALPPNAISLPSTAGSSASVDGNTVQRGSVNLFKQWRLLLDEPTLVELDPETNMTTAATSGGTGSDGGTAQSLMPSSSQSSSSSRRIGPPRFEGFASWERTLQEWADDVQEYMDKIEAENPGYPMSTFGNPQMAASSSRKPAVDKKDEFQTQSAYMKKEEKIGASERKPSSSKEKKKPISLPVPAAAKDGEEVVPHTDISDKSKNLWIVTTAALPWMTGTAVNPALRAAYLTKGRAEAGGSVTLMLPWLERIIDQENVYGVNRVFESPMAQEAYIRTWLKDTANLPEASERLRIQWYTAWQNKVENSVYSMGDITALIPAEEVDICILEEPEHLNW
jgi:hypothetical protein